MPSAVAGGWQVAASFWQVLGWIQVFIAPQGPCEEAQRGQIGDFQGAPSWPPGCLLQPTRGERDVSVGVATSGSPKRSLLFSFFRFSRPRTTPSLAACVERKRRRPG